MKKFELISKYKPTGDQPDAIKKITEGIEDGFKSQVLLGVTGSGKTFTMANIIQNTQRPALVMAHNKTLAAQLCNELREFFPHNRVEFFVSYYDYYQPEAYIVSSDTYIEKDMQINDEIDKLRHSATCSLIERRDVIVVASVSCIYGLGSPAIQYQRNDMDFTRATFRVRGDVLEIFPAYSSEIALRVEFFGDQIEKLSEINALTGKTISVIKHAVIFPASHYAVGSAKLKDALQNISNDADLRVKELNEQGKILEAERLKQRTAYDLEMMTELGYCNGIENYSRYFDGRQPGEAPYTLLDYFPKDFITFIDESHMSIPQTRAMYSGDRSRKTNLVEYGFRLPSAYDNRPLNFSEFNSKLGQVVYISATPAPYELKEASQVAEQIIRPTGLIDPEIEVRKIEGQIDDLMTEINRVTAMNGRVLVTTLTKKMSEDLTKYLAEYKIKVRYLHSEIDTLERIEILNALRMGEFEVLVGINLLREGLDLPEVMLVAILDADKEGFLRSESALIQTVGRAARNSEGKVIMYADKMTDSMKRAIGETNRRRKIQTEYNVKHNITPTTIIKEIKNTLEITKKATTDLNLSKSEIPSEIEKLKGLMQVASASLDFEQAIKLRDTIGQLKKMLK